MNRPVVLIIDDERPVRRLIRTALEVDGYSVHEAETGRQGIEELAYRRPDAVVLDLSLPDMDGTDVLRRIRDWAEVPVLVLSVRDDVRDKVQALDLGADDYLTKPFHMDELGARLRVLRRHQTAPHHELTFESGRLKVDFQARQLTISGTDVHLTSTEFALLGFLIRHREKVVTHSQLLRAVWGPAATEQAQYLRVYVNRLRKKLQRGMDELPAIRTETGIGYRFQTAGE